MSKCGNYFLGEECLHLCKLCEVIVGHAVAIGVSRTHNMVHEQVVDEKSTFP